MNKKAVFLIGSILGCQLVGVIGSFFTAPNIAVWYSHLNKPFFNPPDWIFAPAWTVIYTLMGISLFLVWKKGLEEKNVNLRPAFIVFGIQLVLNLLWSFVFFSLKQPFYAFIEIIILWFSILLTMAVFYRISKTASLILIPYIAWVTFAALLNFFIFRLN